MGAAVLIALMAGACASARPPATAPAPAPTPIDEVTLNLYIATCQWTWFDELGDVIDEPDLLACVKAAARGQTLDELRAQLRARPDHRRRVRRNNYGRPSIGRRAFCPKEPS
jgi:hypothetical protein